VQEQIDDELLSTETASKASENLDVLKSNVGSEPDSELLSQIEFVWGNEHLPSGCKFLRFERFISTLQANGWECDLDSCWDQRDVKNRLLKHSERPMLVGGVLDVNAAIQASGDVGQIKLGFSADPRRVHELEIAKEFGLEIQISENTLTIH